MVRLSFRLKLGGPCSNELKVGQALASAYLIREFVGHIKRGLAVKYDSDAKVIVISALSDKSIVVQCLELGARDFIQKPLKFKNEEFCKEFLETFNDLMV